MPAALTLREATTPDELRRFLAVPQQIYRDDPLWVPPLRAHLHHRLRHNPFVGGGRLRLFLASRGSEDVGTISVLLDRSHERHRGERAAFFGFFETVDDPEVAEALIGVAEQQARLWGADILRGPRNLSRIEATGITVEGWEKPPPMMAGHHPRYYAPMFDAMGFQTHHDVLAYDIDAVSPDGSPVPLPEQLAERAAAVDIDGLEVRAASWRHTNRDLGLCHEVFTDAFKDVPENTPMSRTQFVSVGRALLAVTNRRMLQLATVNGRAAGFALCFPEMNEAIRRAGGHLAPLGWARILRGMRHIRTASFKLLGVLPEFRKAGLSALLIREAIEGVRSLGYERLEASLIDARNKPMRYIVESAGLDIYRRYRVYERAI